MFLEIKNIGIIKEANIKIDGLTVIAGENDTGKSTVGKVLYSLIKTVTFSSNIEPKDLPMGNIYQYHFDMYTKKLFKNKISKNGSIKFDFEDNIFELKIKQNRCISFEYPPKYKNTKAKMFKPLLIDSPLIWNMYETLETINSVKNQESIMDNIDFSISQTIQDLHFALSVKMKDNYSNNLSLKINNIIGGSFEQDGLGNFSFNKDDDKIELINTSMGIKYFGILQVLENKNHLHHDQILILDEPEVHLHPKWQLMLAEVIVKLVKSGVKIVVNSHSPYMIEALELFSKRHEVKSNYYLSEKNENGTSNITSQGEDLNYIYKKLAQPFTTLEEMALKDFKW
ncbi:MAG: ABC transporter ATP-binding protein [uncultured Campylobacterales bacterium]|uniref:ABC transporter ATP-binding protein n=1 Tax=uncultured Campylobacterales bacterium TaxID=352960 RepID=A0A6S6SCJ4_9BACT|nr:MAG: ABC transporter ATP-binding protein [uncultured Campylobacterales bacterium]